MIISFPHLANYALPLGTYLKNILPNATIVPAPPNTAQSLEIGSKHSPESVCLPFKYNLGNFIQALDNGADILLCAGGGCRYGLYGEVHEQILKDMGYKFTFINIFAQSESVGFSTIYNSFKNINSALTIKSFIYYSLLALKAIKVMDEIDVFVRQNMAFQTQKGSFENTHKNFLHDLKHAKTFKSLKKIEMHYKKKFLAIPLSVPENIIKVGLVGELYSLMDSFSNFFLEKELAKYNISLTRYINLTYLITKKRRHVGRSIKYSGGIIKYHLGADGTCSVVKSVLMAKNGYAGIIHLKPFGCTPEINAIPALINVSNKYKIPIIYLSFDTQTSETGLKTRIEAFADMLISGQTSLCSAK